MIDYIVTCDRCHNITRASHLFTHYGTVLCQAGQNIQAVRAVGGIRAEPGERAPAGYRAQFYYTEIGVDSEGRDRITIEMWFVPVGTRIV